jgi:hypothetical protein
MDIKSFFVEFRYHNNNELAEIRPCCQENNVFYYDVYRNNQFQFTITPATDDAASLTWKIALKNADKHVDTELVELLGEQIEKHYFNTAL